MGVFGIATEKQFETNFSKYKQYILLCSYALFSFIFCFLENMKHIRKVFFFISPQIYRRLSRIVDFSKSRQTE